MTYTHCSDATVLPPRTAMFHRVPFLHPIHLALLELEMCCISCWWQGIAKTGPSWWDLSCQVLGLSIKTVSQKESNHQAFDHCGRVSEKLNRRKLCPAVPHSRRSISPHKMLLGGSQVDQADEGIVLLLGGRWCIEAPAAEDIWELKKNHQITG